MLLEARKGDLHAAYVRREFVTAVRAFLPEPAFAELDALEPTQIESWAERHGVNAPCVLEAFSVFCAGGWSEVPRFPITTWNAPKIPTSWLEKASELNRLPVDAGLSKGMNGDLFDLTAAKRKERRKTDRRFIDAATKNPFLTPAAAERCLAPIAADPSRETREEFEIRAKLHWKARSDMAKRFGLRPAGKETEWRNLERDIQWLLRHQVGRETFEAIAGPNAEPDTVQRAIDRLSLVVGLKRKVGRRPNVQKQK